MNLTGGQFEREVKPGVPYSPEIELMDEYMTEMPTISEYGSGTSTHREYGSEIPKLKWYESELREQAGSHDRLVQGASNQIKLARLLHSIQETDDNDVCSLSDNQLDELRTLIRQLPWSDLLLAGLPQNASRGIRTRWCKRAFNVVRGTFRETQIDLDGVEAKRKYVLNDVRRLRKLDPQAGQAIEPLLSREEWVAARQQAKRPLPNGRFGAEVARFVVGEVVQDVLQEAGLQIATGGGVGVVKLVLAAFPDKYEIGNYIDQ